MEVTQIKLMMFLWQLTSQKNSRKAREARSMVEFLEGRANFADNAETDGGAQMTPKPDFTSYSKPRKQYIENKRLAR
jgi:hypothetical protein